MMLLMCKDERRWKSLKKDITLHLVMILQKVHLLNFFFSKALAERQKQFLIEGTTRQLSSSIFYQFSMFKHIQKKIILTNTLLTKFRL